MPPRAGDQKAKGRKTKKKTAKGKSGSKSGALRFDQASEPLLADDGFTASSRHKLKASQQQDQQQQQQGAGFQAPDLYVGAVDSRGGAFSPSYVRQALILFYDRHDPSRADLDDVLDILLDYAARQGVAALNRKLKAKYGEDLDAVEVVDLDELFPEMGSDYDEEDLYDLPPPAPEDNDDSEDPPPLPEFSDNTLRRLKKMAKDRHSVDAHRSVRASSDGLPPPPPLPPPLVDDDDGGAPPPPPLPPLNDDDDGEDEGAGGRSKSKRKSFFKSARKSIFGGR